MTQADAMQNVINALSAHRALQGQPREIEIAFDGNAATLSSGWSKSTVQKTRFEQQIVFLVMDRDGERPWLATTNLVRHGEKWYPIDTAAIKPPGESGYWLLPAKREV